MTLVWRIFTVIWNLGAFYSLQIEHYALKIAYHYAMHQYANWNLRVIGCDTVLHKMHLPSLLKVHKQ